MHQAPAYPTIQFLTRWGGWLAVLLGLAVPVTVLWLVATGACAALWLLPALVGGAVLWLVLRSYVDVLRILADTLMPR